MEQIRIGGLPRLKFAHRFAANEYRGFLEKTENNYEITIVTEGSIMITDSEKTVVGKRGDILVNSYCKRREVRSVGGYHSHSTVCFTFDSSNAAETVISLPRVTKAEKCPSNVASIIDEILKLHLLSDGRSLRISALILLLIDELGAVNETADERRQPGKNRYAALAKKFVYDHIYEPIGQREIAAHLGITPEYLCSIFKESEGVTLMHFINTLKLSRVRSMMESSNISLSIAAAQYGYADPNYVSRLYKKYFGETVTQAVKLPRRKYETYAYGESKKTGK